MRELSDAEKQQLEQHRLSIVSSGREGRRLNWSHADLRSANLGGAEFCYANLRGADLSNAHSILIITPIGSRGDMLVAVLHPEVSGGVMLKTGCFWGTIEEFLAANKEKHGDGWYMQLNPTWLVTGYLVVGMVAENAGVQRYSISVWEMPQFSGGDTASWVLLPLVERIEHARDEDYYALCNKYDPRATTRASWRGTLADRLCGRRREQERLDRIMDYCHGVRNDAAQAHTAPRLGEDDYRALNCAMDLGWNGA